MWHKRPLFWQTNHSLAAWLLQPLSWVYRGMFLLRNRLIPPARAAVPVICIGNVTVGGAGKTPVAIAIAQHLQQQGKKPAFLSRGYGGRLTTPIRVDPLIHTAEDVGDEPLLLCRTALTYVAKDRVAGAKAAVTAGANILVMDDGFQNPSLYKDTSLLVIDGAYGFGNGQLLPAGPLREPCNDAFARADACIILGEDSYGVQQHIPPHLPVLSARLAPVAGTDLTEKTYVAFAGIGSPEKFFAILTSLEVNVAATQAYPDHYPYMEKDLQSLWELAQQHQAALVTTEKDWVRLSPSWQQRIHSLPVVVVWNEPEMVGTLLQKFYPRISGRPLPGNFYKKDSGFPPMQG